MNEYLTANSSIQKRMLTKNVEEGPKASRPISEYERKRESDITILASTLALET
jgi:hypothetical protein